MCTSAYVTFVCWEFAAVSSAIYGISIGIVSAWFAASKLLRTIQWYCIMHRRWLTWAEYMIFGHTWTETPNWPTNKNGARKKATWIILRGWSLATCARRIYIFKSINLQYADKPVNIYPAPFHFCPRVRVSTALYFVATPPTLIWTSQVVASLLLQYLLSFPYGFHGINGARLTRALIESFAELFGFHPCTQYGRLFGFYHFVCVRPDIKISGMEVDDKVRARHLPFKCKVIQLW